MSPPRAPTRGTKRPGKSTDAVVVKKSTAAMVKKAARRPKG